MLIFKSIQKFTQKKIRTYVATHMFYTSTVGQHCTIIWHMEGRGGGGSVGGQWDEYPVSRHENSVTYDNIVLLLCTIKSERKMHLWRWRRAQTRTKEIHDKDAAAANWGSGSGGTGGENEHEEWRSCRCHAMSPVRRDSSNRARTQAQERKSDGKPMGSVSVAMHVAACSTRVAQFTLSVCLGKDGACTIDDEPYPIILLRWDRTFTTLSGGLH